MKAWKVLTADRRSSLTGVSHASGNTRLLVKYPKNKRVFPKLSGSRLMVFKTLTAARQHIAFCDAEEFVIVPCIAYGVRRAEWISFPTDDFRTFWRDYNANPKCVNKHFKYMSAPIGTYFAKSVKCLE